jgi:hypothetical protein
MTDCFTGIIDQLERQKAAIERALVALREVDAPTAAGQVEPRTTPDAPTGRGKKFSAAARRKMALARKARWAKIKGGIAPRTAPPAPEPSTPKRRVSAAGMKRIIAATKKRWRLQKTAAKSAVAKKSLRKRSRQRRRS